MIKKISQLNPLPLTAFMWEDDVIDEELLRKYNEMLFEVSYETANPNDPHAADEIDYYTSYNITLSGLNDALRIPGLCAAITDIYNGGVNVISGNFTIGTANNELNDRAEHGYVSVDIDHDLSVLTRTHLNNSLEVHGETEFHNNVVLKCRDNYSKNYPNISDPILSVEGVATFSNVINGVSYRAKWGDLAEYYEADAKYEPGTLIKFGGEKEVTLATDVANAVVTTDPGILLNSAKSENSVGVALAGKVPVKIRGPVKKFDKIVLSKTNPGIGVVYNHCFPHEIVARALEDNSDKEDKLVLCVVRFDLI